MSEGMILSRGSQVGEKLVIAFAPDDPECAFYLEWRSMPPEERIRLSQDCTNHRNRIDVGKFNRRLALRCVSGWGGLTPREVQRLGLFAVSDDWVAAREAELAEKGLHEIPWHKDTLIDLMANSDAFCERVNELATNTEMVHDARRAWRLRESRSTSSTGVSAAS